MSSFSISYSYSHWITNLWTHTHIACFLMWKPVHADSKLCWINWNLLLKNMHKAGEHEVVQFEQQKRFGFWSPTSQLSHLHLIMKNFITHTLTGSAHFSLFYSQIACSPIDKISTRIPFDSVIRRFYCVSLPWHSAKSSHIKIFFYLSFHMKDIVWILKTFS